MNGTDPLARATRPLTLTRLQTAADSVRRSLRRFSGSGDTRSCPATDASADWSWTWWPCTDTNSSSSKSVFARGKTTDRPRKPWTEGSGRGFGVRGDGSGKRRGVQTCLSGSIWLRFSCGRTGFVFGITCASSTQRAPEPSRSGDGSDLRGRDLRGRDGCQHCVRAVDPIRFGLVDLDQLAAGGRRAIGAHLVEVDAGWNRVPAFATAVPLE